MNILALLFGRTPSPVAPSPAGGGGKPAGVPRRAFDWFGVRTRLFADPVEAEDTLDVAETEARHRRLATLLRWQTISIFVMVILLMIAAPALRPIYKYRAVNPSHQVKEMVALDESNLTSQAVLSWAATSVTEVMTFGFGDIDQQLWIQRSRFTPEGWLGFLKAIINQGLRESFKSQQLVLTTVPSDVPVIVAEGPNEEDRYQWIVEVPIVMTYTTNNNVTDRSRSVVSLTIVRVPSKESIGGIAIKVWK